MLYGLRARAITSRIRATLADAEQIAVYPLPHVAARQTYYAAYHVAAAYIFEQTGRAATTHLGMRGTGLGITAAICAIRVT